ncbi:MAG: RNA degradosome polyphosphate kinase, partial [Pseudanabaena sp.]
MTRIKKDLTKKNGETVTEASVNGDSESLANPEIEGKSNNSLLEPEQPSNPVHKKVDKTIERSRYFFNRELSWIAFNKRVLHEGIDARTPLLERAKFCA